MVSVDYWVEHQGSRTSMPDTSRMIPVIESDWAGRPWVEFGGDGLYSVYVSECAFVLLLWDMSDINHVHYFDLRRKKISLLLCSAGEIRLRLCFAAPSLCVRR